MTSQPAPAGWRLALWGGIIALLLLPLLAMQFTNEVMWTPSDFAFAGALLGGGAALYEVAVRWFPERRRWIAAAILLVVALTWAEGAVGILS